jgi:hypothetical protein
MLAQSADPKTPNQLQPFIFHPLSGRHLGHAESITILQAIVKATLRDLSIIT